MKNNYFQFPDLPDHNALISVKAGAGQGKTKAMIQKIRRTNKKAHVIGYGCGNEMLMQTVRRAKEAGVTIYLLNNEDSVVSLAVRKSANLAYRVSSITEVEGCFAGKDVYIEESCSVLKYIFEGIPSGEKKAERIYAEDEQDELPDLSNERKHLAEVVRVFTAAMVEADRVFLLDGNNSDLYTNFFHNLCPGKKLIKIENTHDAPKHNIKICDAVSDGEIKSRNRSPLIQMLLDPEVIPWIYCDSKERTKILDQMLREGGKSGYCLNAESAGDDWAKQLLADTNKFTADKKPGYVLLSPTAESGISAGDNAKKAEEKRAAGEPTINGWFTDKFTFLAGVSGTNGAMQGMFRLRDESIPHYLFCPEQSTVKNRNSPHTFSAKQYQEIIDRRILESGLLASQSANNPGRVLEVIGNAIARSKDDWWEMSVQLGVLDNYEMANLRKCLIYALQEAGHNVEIVPPDGYKGAEESEQTAKSVVDWDR